MNYDNFLENGFLDLGEIIDKKKCNELYSKIESSRNWGQVLFRSEADVNRKLFPDKTKENLKGGTNPGKGKCNYAETVDLSFIEENRIFKKTITDICGPNFEVLLKKLVVAIPNNWTPKWLQNRMKKDYFDNLNPYIKEEFRDFTYFRGIDYHMDIMDQLNTKADIITIYVYINDVEENMSPLHVINKSHKFCETVFPHLYEEDNDERKSIILCDGDYKEKMSKEILVGNKGNVYLWSSLIFHRSKPFKSSDKPRISLRYTIKKNKDLKNNYIIDDFLEKNKLANFRNIKNNTAIIKKENKSSFDKNSNNKMYY